MDAARTTRDVEGWKQRIRDEFVVGAYQGGIDGFQQHMVHDAQLNMHSRAVMKGQEVLTAVSYSAPRVRDSSHVLVRYEEDGRDVTYVGQVQEFVHVAAPASTEYAHHAHDLHLAVVNFAPAKAPIRDAAVAPVFVADMGATIRGEETTLVHLEGNARK